MKNTNSVHTYYFVRIIHKLAPCRRFRFGNMGIRTIGIWKNGDPLGSVPIAYAGVIMIQASEDKKNRLIGFAMLTNLG